MKKILYLLFLSFLNFSYGQNQKSWDSIYIYVSNDNFVSDLLGYKAFFSIESVDNRFKHDVYFFKINFPDLNNHTLFNLGKIDSGKEINYINPKEFFKDKTSCDLHIDLSLYKKIYIITEIPDSQKLYLEDKSKTHIIWYTNYAGTVKDITFMNMNSKNLLDE